MGVRPPTSSDRPAADKWRKLGRTIDSRVVAGADWPGLAAGLDRAARAGYDVDLHLPRLAAAAALPDRRPAWTLHARLIHECPAALPPSPRPTGETTTDAQPTPPTPPSNMTLTGPARRTTVRR